jgi:5-methylcytosine-specific restriction endonuclease McrA
MPDRDVATIKDLIFYQYAKIIAKRAMHAPDGKQAKSSHYGFIKTTFRELKTGKKNWSEITREDWQFVESDKECIYCGAKEDLQREHIVPKSILIKPECVSCDTIQSIHNQVWGCRTCNSKKSTMGLYSFYRDKYPSEKKFYDFIPTLLEKKYLKTIYSCHECANTLNASDLDGDGEITVLDLDYVFTRP